ncbi:PREDICTED: melanocortin receptor 3-like [Priapulus caudatus]|uniref:Melanocortin receptor 3-like n=1 Tax=Priapulus caudatus TaxID=37621 RepID=A0ABM1EP87_PRICU|nr:PREDICTED: melanocortin receptor 3-like [Priapulus caudatus]
MEPRNYTILDDNGTIEHITNHTNGELQDSHNPQAKVGVLYATFILVVAITAIVLNALIINVYIRFDFLQTQRNYFIINLACTDTLVAVAGGAGIFSRAFVPEFNQLFCGIFVFVAGSSVPASILTIGLATLDRYIAIVHPLRYNQLMTPRAAKLMLLFVWLCTSVYGLIVMVQAFIRWRPGTLCVVDMISYKGVMRYVAINYMGVLLFMTYAYVVIGRIMIDHSRRVAAATNQAQLQQLPSLAGTFKAAKLILTVVGVSYLLISPNILHMILATTIIAETHPQSLATLRQVRNAAIMVNMFLNPIMYFMKYDEFKVAMRKLFGRCGASVEPTTTHAPHIIEDVAQVGGQISETEAGQMSDSGGQASHSRAKVSHTGGQISHGDGQVSNEEGQVSHSGGQVTHIQGQVTHREEHMSPTGEQVSHIRGQVSGKAGEQMPEREEIPDGEGARLDGVETMYEIEG